MSTHLRTLIIQYAKTLPNWQKILAKRAFSIEKDNLSDREFINLALLRFKYDLKIRSIEEVGSEIISEINSLQDNTDNSTESFNTRLIEISEIIGVNALESSQKITFSPKLTIIYGNNGSGKSGYSRLFNNAFFSRGDKEILPNILLPSSEQKKVQAKFKFKTDGIDHEFSFADVGLKKEFSVFACFDSKTVEAHVGKENELFILPNEMKFFKKLADLTTEVKNEITNELNLIKVERKFEKEFIGDSDIKTKIISVNNLNELEKLKQLVIFTNTFEAEFTEAKNDYNSFKEINPVERSEIIKSAIKELQVIKTYIFQARNIFNDVSVKNIKLKFAEIETLKKEIKDHGLESFKSQFFQITDSQIWRNFIASSIDFIKTEKDLNHYPSCEEVCPLCLQKLNDEAIDLFKKYFKFLASEREIKIKNLENDIQVFRENVIKFTIKNVQQYPNLSSLFNPKEDQFIKIKNHLENINLSKDNANIFMNDKNYNELNGIEYFDEENYTILLDKLNNMLKELKGDKYQENLKIKEKKFIDYEHKKLFISKREEMELFFKELAYKNILIAEEKKITTRSITEKQKNIFNEYFTKQYKHKFHSESSSLGVNFNIDIKPRGSDGSTGRKLDILNHLPSKILSEGEQRAIALADFLTEVDICKISGGLIFDDPVNSLDHQRKAYIAKRLVKESHIRQIIILTHDISFFYDLTTEAEKEGFKHNENLYCHWINRIDNTIGVIDLNRKKRMESDYQKPTRAEEYLQRSLKEQDIQGIEDLVKQGFNCLRSTYEAFVLFSLLGDTVVRFDRQIKHKSVGKIYCPIDIGRKVSHKLELCSGFIDAHLAADLYQSQAPTPEKLQHEIEEFKIIQKDWKERMKSDLGGI